MSMLELHFPIARESSHGAGKHQKPQVPADPKKYRWNNSIDNSWLVEVRVHTSQPSTPRGMQEWSIIGTSEDVQEDTEAAIQQGSKGNINPTNTLHRPSRSSGLHAAWTKVERRTPQVTRHALTYFSRDDVSREGRRSDLLED